MTVMSFKEYNELEEIVINPVTVIQGARLISAALTRAGINVGKMMLPFPLGGIKGAIGGTALGAVATKYGFDSIVSTQAGLSKLMIDVFGVSAKVAAAISEKIILSVGTITLGMILLVLLPAKTRKKAIESFKNIKKKVKLKMADIKKIGKELKAV